MLMVILGVVAAALAVGTLVYLAKQLTVSVLKKYKTKKNSKVLAATVKDLLKQAPTMKLDGLGDNDVILAEYDEDEDELAQDISIANDVDDRVRGILDTNRGIVVFD